MPAAASEGRYSNDIVLLTHARRASMGEKSPDAECARLAAAAHRALSTHPGPVGELIQREIEAFLNFGHLVGSGALIMRLVHEVSVADIAPQQATGGRDWGLSVGRKSGECEAAPPARER
jgi:hypothetical protein